jgi:flagellin
MQRLSSGLRVNSAKDDAAGLAIAERMNAQVRGMNVAMRNANDGISMAQTAEGALSKVGDALQRMRELAVQSRNGTNSDSDKDSLNKEFGELQKEINRVLGGTSFNGKNILGADGTTFTFQIGANTTADDSVDDRLREHDQQRRRVGGDGRPRPTSAAPPTTDIGDVIDDIDTAIDTVNNKRATFGATQSRFEAIIGNLQVSVENQSPPEAASWMPTSRSETANMSRAQILQQAGNAMVAQANQLPQQVLGPTGGAPAFACKDAGA